MVSSIARMLFKQQTQHTIKRLISENRMQFLSDDKLKFTDKSGKSTEYTFGKFASFFVTTLVVGSSNDKNIQRLAKSNNLSSIGIVSSVGISDEQVIEVLNEEYKRSHKK